MRKRIGNEVRRWYVCLVNNRSITLEKWYRNTFKAQCVAQCVDKALGYFTYWHIKLINTLINCEPVSFFSQ